MPPLSSVHSKFKGKANRLKFSAQDCGPYSRKILQLGLGPRERRGRAFRRPGRGTPPPGCGSAEFFPFGALYLRSFSYRYAIEANGTATGNLGSLGCLGMQLVQSLLESLFSRPNGRPHAVEIDR